MAYLRFCCRAFKKEVEGKGKRKMAKQTGSTKAKEVFYRSVAACPWAKELYMEAFREWLNGEFSEGELRGIFQTTVTKGLRVHVDLEEFLERRGFERE